MLNKSEPNRTVLVTGAAGFLGAPVVRRLRRAGHRVLALDDGSVDTLNRLRALSPDPDLYVRQLDIRERVSLMRVMAEFRPWAVIHLAARHFIPVCEAFPAECLEVNVLGTQHLLDACVEYPPRRFLFASTADVYEPSCRKHTEDDPLKPRGVYGNSKLLGESLLRDQAGRITGCEIVVARLFNLYGPHDPHPHLIPEIIRQAREGNMLHLGELDAKRDFVHIEDAAEAMQALLENSVTTVVNIGTGHTTSVLDLVDTLAELTGRRFEVRTDQTRKRRTPRQTCLAAPDKLRELLPWWPRIPVLEGLRRTVATHDDGLGLVRGAS
ncbi:NAD-dependent epimerase/dehydratase family protein [Actinopolyspora sp. H202]|uniref:NAD-dependent epimerase/dehydratase family protein n=1 Tax=Actinopolyspora sp. H202 TaxID=1500456 RepID=UPI003EE548B7